MEIGLPPKVLKWMRFFITSAISGRVTHAPSGAPLPMPLAIVTMSGVTPQFSKPQKCSPVRPKPACTSSAMQRPPCFADDVVDDLEILRRRRDRAADALNRLADEAGDLAGRFVVDDVLDVVGTLQAATRILQAVGAAVAVRRQRVLHVRRSDCF